MSKRYKRVEDKKYFIPVSTTLFYDKESKEEWNEKIKKKKEETDRLQAEKESRRYLFPVHKKKRFKQVFYL